VHKQRLEKKLFATSYVGRTQPGYLSPALDLSGKKLSNTLLLQPSSDAGFITDFILACHVCLPKSATEFHFALVRTEGLGPEKTDVLSF